MSVRVSAEKKIARGEELLWDYAWSLEARDPLRFTDTTPSNTPKQPRPARRVVPQPSPQPLRLEAPQWHNGWITHASVQRPEGLFELH